MAKKIFLICPVRFASEEEKQILADYVAGLENQGFQVHYPSRDTNQVDPTGGYQICTDNRKAIINADEVHLYWSKASQGSLFDLGVAFSEHIDKGKPIKLVNRKDIERIVAEEQKPKSFEKVFLLVDEKSRQ